MGNCSTVSQQNRPYQKNRPYQTLVSIQDLVDPNDILKLHIEKSFQKQLSHIQLSQNGKEKEQEKLKLALTSATHDILNKPFIESTAQDGQLAHVVRQEEASSGNQAGLQWDFQHLVRFNHLKKDEHELAADKPIPPFESLWVDFYMQKIRGEPLTPKFLRLPPISKLLILPTINLRVNLYSCVAENSLKEIKVLKRAAKDERAPQGEPIPTGDSNFPSEAKYVFCSQAGEFGSSWARYVKKDRLALPSFEEVMQGVWNWMLEQLKEEMDKSSRQEQKNVFIATKQQFKVIYDSITIENIKEPMKDGQFDGLGYPELVLSNPYSKVTCFILHLYSMEFGSPPLFSAINKVSRTLNQTELQNLGPIIRALDVILATAENQRHADEKIQTGELTKQQTGGVFNNMAGAFLMYRGVQMMLDSLDCWLRNITKNVHISGIASCSQNLKIALEFAIQDPQHWLEHTAVLFVICCQNYHSFMGVKIDNEAYTQYPAEREVLLREGFPAQILAVEKDVVIANQHESYQRFNGKSITIVHLFHSG